MRSAAPGFKLIAKTVDRKQILIQHCFLGFFALICFFVVALIAGSAMGQDAAGDYESIELKDAFRSAGAIKRMETETRSMAATGKGNGAIVKVYFAQYVPGIMTAPDGLNHISKTVNDINGYLARANKSSRPDIARGLTALTFASMKQVATGNHHPSARIAATVLLSNLVAKPVDLSRKLPPVPWPDALPVLVELYENDKNVDGVRAAALRGIHRHVTYTFNTMPDNVKGKLIATMNGLLDEKAPASRSEDAHAYLQRYAVDVIDYLRSKDDSELGVKLINISTEPKSPSLIALHSAARLGSMSAEIANTVDDPEKVLASWSARSLFAVEDEIQRLRLMSRRSPALLQPRGPSSYLRKAKDNAPAPSMTGNPVGGRTGRGGMGRGGMGRMGMGGMAGMGGMDMMAGGPEVVQPPEIMASRRKLSHVFQQVLQGATGSITTGTPSGKPAGLMAGVPEAQRTAVKTWVSKMAPIVRAINNKSIDDRIKYMEILEMQVEPLEKMAGDLAKKPDDILNAKARKAKGAKGAGGMGGEAIDAAELGDDPFADLLGE